MPSQRQGWTTSWLSRLPPKSKKRTDLDRAKDVCMFASVSKYTYVYILQLHGVMSVS